MNLDSNLHNANNCHAFKVPVESAEISTKNQEKTPFSHDLVQLTHHSVTYLDW